MEKRFHQIEVTFKPRMHDKCVCAHLCCAKTDNKYVTLFKKYVVNLKNAVETGADMKRPRLPDPVALVKSLDHGTRMFRHQSHQQLQHVHEVVVLWGQNQPNVTYKCKHIRVFDLDVF